MTYLPPMTVDGQELPGLCSPDSAFTNEHMVRAMVDMFYADEEEEPDKVVQAKAICWSCPIRQECLTRAMERKEEYGIWGGLTAEERNR